MLYKNVEEFFYEKAERLPEALAVEFVEGNNIQSLNYSQLYQNIAELADYLSTLYGSGERAIVLFPPGLDYIISFFACCFSGIIAVPCFVPSTEASREKLLSIINDCQPRLILTTTTIANDLPGVDPKIQLLCWKNNRNIIKSTRFISKIEPQQIAFLQYTSGTTGQPKGVMVSHGNVINNSERIKNILRHDKNSRMMSWLPPYHDMGLIGGIIQPFYSGIPTRLMATAEFIRAPFKWLHHISDFRATTSGGPNFAYNLCARLSLTHLNIDLSSWRHAYCGAEPIHAKTLATFKERFSSYGFNQAAYLPCYGLAESTLLVTGISQYDLKQNLSVNKTALLQQGQVRVQTDGDTLQLVSSGYSPDDQDLKIVNESNHEILPSGQIGKIVVNSASVAQGYWNNPALSSQTFEIKLSNGLNYLDTGDRGFILDNQLYVIGRIKETLIIHGVKYSPNPIEKLIEDISPKIRANGVVALQLPEQDSGTISIVMELKPLSQDDFVALCQAIKQQVFSHFALSVREIFGVQAKFIPRTTSGKLARHLLPQVLAKNEGILYRASHLIVETSAKNTVKSLPEIQAIIATCLAQMGISTWQESDALADLINDSLKQMQLLMLLEQSLNHAKIPLEIILSAQTVSQLQEKLYQWQPYISDQDLAIDSPSVLPILPLQKMLLTRIGGEEFNLAVILEIKTSTSFHELQQALAKLLTIQPYLRSYYSTPEHLSINDNIEQLVAALSYRSLNSVAKTDLEFLVNEASRSLQINQAPLFRLIFCEVDKKQTYLLAIFHHLLVDPISIHLFFQQWELLLHEASIVQQRLQQNIHHEFTLVQENLQIRKPIEELTPLFFAKNPAIETLTDPRNIIANETQLCFKISVQQYALIQAFISEHNFSLDSVLIATIWRALQDKLELGDYLQFMHRGRNLLAPSHRISHLIAWMNFSWPVWLPRQNMDLLAGIAYVQHNLQETMSDAWDYNLHYWQCIEKNSSLVDFYTAKVEYSFIGSLLEQQTKNIFQPSALLVNEYLIGKTFAPKLPRYREIFIRPQIKQKELLIHVFYPYYLIDAASLHATLQEHFTKLIALIQDCHNFCPSEN